MPQIRNEHGLARQKRSANPSLARASPVLIGLATNSAPDFCRQGRQAALLLPRCSRDPGQKPIPDPDHEKTLQAPTGVGNSDCRPWGEQIVVDRVFRLRRLEMLQTGALRRKALQQASGA
jgi:hypothetical protein